MNNICTLQDQLLFLGIGQCGSNIVKEFFDLGYSSMFVNTTIDDLKALTDVPESQKFQIPGAQGSRKDRNLSKSYFRNSYTQLLNIIKNKYSSCTHIFVSFSMGGGTGSGSTALINALSKQLPNVKFNIVPVVPAMNEGPRTKYNTLECFNEILKMTEICGVYMVDNSSDVARFNVNKRIATNIHNLLTLNANPDKRGNIDGEEITQLISIKGAVYFVNIDHEDRFPVQVDNITVPYLKNGKFSTVAYCLKEDEDFCHTEVENIFGKARHDIFRGYNPYKSFAIITGAPISDLRMSQIYEQYNTEKAQIEETPAVRVTGFQLDGLEPPKTPTASSTPTKSVQELFDEF